MIAMDKLLQVSNPVARDIALRQYLLVMLALKCRNTRRRQLGAAEYPRVSLQAQRIGR